MAAGSHASEMDVLLNLQKTMPQWKLYSSTDVNTYVEVPFAALPCLSMRRMTRHLQLLDGNFCQGPQLIHVHIK
ncbi:hypothetical protein GN956_G1214 [Arapaima gigas]